MEKISWQSPSNIAIIKYWGKYGNQLPRNPSVSFTLKHAVTKTTMIATPLDKTSGTPQVKFFLAGVENPAFADRVTKFFGGIREFFPFIESYHYEIHSENSFPHSSGIASSASGMSALALCLCELAMRIQGQTEAIGTSSFIERASFISRLGSGSACRSLYPKLASWGETDAIIGASDTEATPCEDWLHPLFNGFHDDILIVSKKEKSVSSTVGHGLMDQNIYAESRYNQAKSRMSVLMDAFRTGDIQTFGEIAESEALTLHALMMCSTPSFILMKPNTLKIIEEIRNFRADTKLPLFFTLDAGPNIHMLYPDQIAKEVADFRESQLKDLCQDGFMLLDEMGEGPIRL